MHLCDLRGCWEHQCNILGETGNQRGFRSGVDVSVSKQESERERNRMFSSVHHFAVPTWYRVPRGRITIIESMY